jgi:hypothetical protein
MVADIEDRCFLLRPTRDFLQITMTSSRPHNNFASLLTTTPPLTTILPGHSAEPDLPSSVGFRAMTRPRLLRTTT